MLFTRYKQHRLNESPCVGSVLPRRELARGLEYGTDHRVTSKKSVLGRSSPSASSRYDQSSEAKAEIDPEARAGEPEVRATSRSKCPGAVRTERCDGAEGTAPSTGQAARTETLAPRETHACPVSSASQ